MNARVPACGNCEHFRTFNGGAIKQCFHPDAMKSAEEVNVITGEVRYRGADLEPRAARRYGPCGVGAKLFKPCDGSELVPVRVVRGFWLWKREFVKMVDLRHAPGGTNILSWPCFYD